MNKISFLLILIVTAISCGKNSKFMNYPITNTEIRNALSYQKGSYFIYKDSLSGKVDSIWISLPYNNWVTNSIGDGYSQSIELIGYKLNDSLGEVGYAATDGTGNKIDNYIIQGGIFQLSSNIYSNYYKLNQIDSNNQGYFLFSNHYDSIVINGTKYYEVLESFNKTSKTEQKTFFNLSVGILKTVIKTDSSNFCWELSKFHIERKT